MVWFSLISFHGFFSEHLVMEKDCMILGVLVKGLTLALHVAFVDGLMMDTATA